MKKVAKTIKKSSKKSPSSKSVITAVFASEILDSRGVPTIEAEVHLASGAKAWAQVPSGASTGAAEALELRDGDPHRYFGKGVLYAIKNIKGEIAELVIGLDACDQEALDEKMIYLDGTDNKSRLGANAILAVSLAACRAAAVHKKVPLYEHIRSLSGGRQNDYHIPTPMFNIINGGEHADSGLAIQEYKVVPHGVESFKEQYRAGAEIFHALKNLLADSGMVTAVGDEGGFAPRLANNEEPLNEIASAVENAGYVMGRDVSIAIDAAANSFYRPTCDHYVFELEKQAMSKSELFAVYDLWIAKKYLMSIEDGLREDDWEGWGQMNTQLGNRVMLIGDDHLVTNVKRLVRAIKEKTCNAVLIKPNQIGTLTETLRCMKLAQKNNMKTIVSHRSGETIDDFIADLAVGARADYMKTGSLSRGERLVKYNRLLAIERQIAAIK